MTTPDQTPTTPIPAAKAASSLYIRTADALVGGGGLLMFLFSFAPFVSSFGLHKNAWTFLTPVVLFVVFAAILLIATALIDTFWHRSKQIVGLNRHHVQVGLALYALVTLFAFAVADNTGVSFGWGGVFMLIGAIIAAAGAILNHFNLLQNQLAMPASMPKRSNVYGTPQAGPPPTTYPAQPGYAPPTQAQSYAPPPAQDYTQPGYQPPASQGYPAQPSDPQGPNA